MASMRSGELLVMTAIVAAALLPPLAGLLVFGLFAWPRWPRAQSATPLVSSEQRAASSDS
jgi:hypothetical protein